MEGSMWDGGHIQWAGGMYVILGRRQVGEWRGWLGGWVSVQEGRGWGEGDGWVSWGGVGWHHCDGSVILDANGGGSGGSM